MVDKNPLYTQRGRKIPRKQKKLFCVVVAKLSEMRGNMDLPMVQGRASWALLAVNGLVERRGRFGE